MPSSLILLLLVLLTVLTGSSDTVDPWNIQDNLVVPAGELNGSNTIGQTFVAHYPRLDAIQVRWVISDDFESSRHSRAILHLRRHIGDTVDVRTASIALSEIRHNDSSKFVFAPIQESQGQSYYFFVEVLQPERRRGLSLWASDEDDYPDGQMYLNGLSTDQDLAFRAFYEPDLLMLAKTLANALRQHGRGVVFALLIFLVPGLALLFLLGEPGNLHVIQRIAMAGGLSLAMLSAGSILLLWRGIFVDHLSIYAVTAGLFLLIGGRLLLTRTWDAWRRSTCEIAAESPRTKELLPRSLRSRSTGFAQGDKFRDVPSLAILRNVHLPNLALWVLGALAMLSIGVGLIQIQGIPVPLWVDSPVHAGYIKTLVDHGYLPVDNFYHLGYHAVVALLVQLAGILIPQAMLVVGQLLITQAGLATFLLSHRLSGSVAAGLASAIAVWFLSPTPAYFVTWGRYPLLMGAALLPVALYFAVRLIEKPNLDGRVLFFAIVTFVGLAFSQVRLVAFYILFVVVYLVYTYVSRSVARPSLRAIAWRMGLAAGLSLLFAILWLTALFAEGVQWQTILAQNAAAPSIDFATALAVSLSHHGPVLWIMAFFGLSVGLARRSKVALIALVWYISLGLIAATLQSAIGVSLVVLMGFLPAALLVGDLVRTLISWEKRVSVRFAALWIAGGVIVSIIGARDMMSLVNPATVLFTDADQRATEWIKRSTLTTDRFLVNSFAWFDLTFVPSDGGGWIPVLTDRAVVFIPHAINDGDAVSQWIRSQPVQYIYLGRRSGILKASFFEHQPERYTLVYKADGIRIFRVTSD